MFSKPINLTYLFVIQEIEDILLACPEYPHHKAFSVPHWRQRLISYILTHISNRYVVMEEMQDISRDSDLFRFPIEEKLYIESVIQKGILIFLETHPDFIEKSPEHILQPVIYSLDCHSCVLHDHKVASIFAPDYCLGVADKERGNSSIYSQKEYLRKTIKKLDRQNWELSVLTDISELLQVCGSKYEVYQGLTKLLPGLFLRSKGGFFAVNCLSGYIEAIATWGDVVDSQELVRDLGFSGHQSNHNHNSSDSQIYPLLITSESVSISIKCRDNSLEFLSIQTKGNNPLTSRQQDLAYKVVHKTALALSSLKLRDKLQAQVIHDPLTHLFNRRYLHQSLSQEIKRAKRSNSPIGIAMIDIDNFREINDFGHLVGDFVLQKLASCLRSNVRDSDIVFRYGGDEFMIILFDSFSENFHSRAEQIRQRVYQLDISYKDLSLPLMTISIGLASFPDHGKTPSSLISSADQALFAAKKQGKNLIVQAHP